MVREETELEELSQKKTLPLIFSQGLLVYILSLVPLYMLFSATGSSFHSLCFWGWVRLYQWLSTIVPLPEKVTLQGSHPSCGITQQLPLGNPTTFLLLPAHLTIETSIFLLYVGRKNLENYLETFKCLSLEESYIPTSHFSLKRINHVTMPKCKEAGSIFSYMAKRKSICEIHENTTYVSMHTC